MSTDDDLYLKTGLTITEVADLVAREMGGQLASLPDDPNELSLTFQLAGFPKLARILFSSNIVLYDDGYHDVVEGYAVDLGLRYPGGGDRQRAFSLAFTREWVRRINWPALLIHQFVWVMAANDPDRGYREFPADRVNVQVPYESLWSDTAPAP